MLNRLSSVDSKTLGSKDNVELELAGGGTAGALVLAGGRVVLDGVEVDHEIVLDGEHGVGCEPRVVLGVDLCDDGLVVFVGDLGEIELVKVVWGAKIDLLFKKTHHQVDVCGSHRVPVNSLQELPRRAVFGEGVGGGAQAVEAVLALVVGLELAAQVVVAEGRVLEVVLAVAAGLPHVEGDVGDGLMGHEVADHAVHVGDLALVVVLDDGVAELAPGGVGGPEGAEDGGGCGVVVGVVGLDVVCDFSYEAEGGVS